MRDETPVDQDDLGSLLAVFAHPDDEAYLAGSLMARAVDDGRRVVCVTATRGELGFADDDPRPLEERAEVRSAELAACLAELGVGEHHWLGMVDGTCSTVPESGPVTRLVELIDEVAPDTILTFGPDGQTRHPDHIAVGRWTTVARGAASHRAHLLYAALTRDLLEQWVSVMSLDELMMVPGAEPETVGPDELAVEHVSEGTLLDRKVRALRSQASQVEGLVGAIGVDTFRDLVRTELYREPRPGDWSPAGCPP